jgi:transposase InsO family protein
VPDLESDVRHDPDDLPLPPTAVPRTRGRRGRRLVAPEAGPRRQLTGEQRLLALDAWRQSGLRARDFAPLVGVSIHTLYKWRELLISDGAARLLGRPGRRREGSRLPPATLRAILLLKETHPDWGCDRISAELARGPALAASPGAISRALQEAGYQLEEQATRPHAPPERRFERDAPNQLWQTDLFTFVLKRQNRRVYLVAFMDDHSRFIVSHSLGGTQSTELVLEALRAGIASHGVPTEILTDNGAQYVTWRGKSAFSKECEARGIVQIVARPRRPQTLGKIERFWGTLWRDLLEHAVFLDLADARKRIDLFIEHYNFRRPHQGIGDDVPADRFFRAAPQVRKALEERLAANALEIARGGEPKEPFYLAGQVGGRAFSLHAEGERVFLRAEDGERREIDLAAAAPSPVEEPPAAPSAESTPASDPWPDSPELPPRCLGDRCVARAARRSERRDATR